jgi:hypothetical protein
MSRFNENPSDRRIKQRFPLQRELRFKLLDQTGAGGGGTGQSLDISSGGIAFTTDQYLPAEANVEISMSWPVTLENACPLRLVIKGRVLRNQGMSVICTIDKFEFRTQARNQNTISILAGVAAMRTRQPLPASA